MTTNIRQVVILICLLVLSPMACPVFALTIAIPNTHHWDSYSPWSSVYSNSSIDSSQSAPGSSLNSLKFHYAVGHTGGTAPDKVWVNLSTPVSEMWAQYWFKYSAGFDFEGQGMKQAFWKLNSISGSNESFFVALENNKFKMQFQRNAPVSGAGVRYSSGPIIQTGVWYKVTVRAVMNTVDTAEGANGIFQLWVNDQLAMNFSDCRYRAGGDFLNRDVNEMQFVPTWGSSTSVHRTTAGDFYVDYTTISNDPIGSVPSSPDGKSPQPPSNLTIG